MKESVGSLKAYFIFFAVLYLLGSIGSLSLVSQNVFVLVSWAFQLAFGMAYLSTGLSLRKLLVQSPNRINLVIYASLVQQVFSFIFQFLFIGLQPRDFISLSIAVAVAVYLLFQVRRLSKIEKSRAESKSELYNSDFE